MRKEKKEELENRHPHQHQCSDNQQDHNLLPYGRLREPWINIKRSDAVFITKDTPRPFLKSKISESILIFDLKIIIVVKFLIW